MSDRLRKLLDEIDQKKAVIDKHRLPKIVREKLEEHLNVDWTYNSNAIEGNSLSRHETYTVITQGLTALTVSGKPIKDYLEAINHKTAIDYIAELARRDSEITELDIRQIHALVLKYIDEENAGRYRRIQIYISSSSHVPPGPVDVPPQMQDFGKWLKEEGPLLHPVEYAALAHLKLVTIHPFIDGNGRTARLLMNLILLKYGYPIAIIQQEQRNRYYDVLEHAHKTGDTGPFIQLIAEAVNQTADKYLKSIPDLQQDNQSPI